jgi:hypothetical protein
VTYGSGRKQDTSEPRDEGSERRDGSEAEGIFEADGILDEAGGEGFPEGAELRLGEAGDNDFYLEVLHAQRARGGFGSDADEQALGRKAAEAEILGDGLADTAAQSDEQQLGGSHAVVGGAVLSGLVEDDAMLAGLGDEAGAMRVLQGHIQARLQGTPR